MKYLWMVLLALSLVACGSGKTPPPDKFARFVGNTGEQLQTDKRNFEAYQAALTALSSDPFIDIVFQILGLADAQLEVEWESACLVNVVEVENNILSSEFHTISPQCDCLTVTIDKAVECIGDVLPDDVVPVFVSGALDDSDVFLDGLRLMGEVCPTLDGVDGIPFVPPECTGDHPLPSVLPNLSTSSAAAFSGFKEPYLERFSFSGILPTSVAPYLTASGEEAQVFTYTNVETEYVDCTLDAQLVLAFDEQGNIVPASKPPENDEVEEPTVYRVIETYLVADEPVTCSYTTEPEMSDNANTEDVDNALSPSEGLDVTVTTDFDVLEEGELSLDYENRFYKVPRQ